MNAELQFLTALQGLHTPARDAVMLFFTRLGNAGFAKGERQRQVSGA